MKRTVDDWKAAVCRHPGLPVRAALLGYWLGDRMKQGRTVSVPEAEMREAFNISRTTVIGSIMALKEAGLLDTIVVGRKGMTAVYQGTFPSTFEGATRRTEGMGDAAREALAAHRQRSDVVIAKDSQRSDVVIAESTYMRSDVVIAKDGDSDHTWWSPRSKRSLDSEGDSPTGKSRSLRIVEPDESPTSIAEEFAEFWDAYPKQIEMTAAKHAYVEARKITTASEILAGAKSIGAYVNAGGMEWQFLKKPAVWLAARLWTDRYGQVKKEPRSPWDIAKECSSPGCTNPPRQGSQIRRCIEHSDPNLEAIAARS